MNNLPSYINTDYRHIAKPWPLAVIEKKLGALHILLTYSNATVNQFDDSKRIDELHSLAKRLILKNYDDDHVANELTNSGVDRYYAEMIVGNVKQDIEDRRSFMSSMIMGGFYIVAGLLINIFSYDISSSSRSTIFFIFWGVVVFGLITIIRGVILYKK